MPATKIALQFRGYWRDINVAYIPPISGIYCVYSCFNNAWNNMLTLNELFYIGLANDGRQRLAKHERKQDWIERLRPGEELCYNFAPIMWPNRERAEAAMIHEHHPWANDEYVTNFPFDRTTIVVSGDCLRLRMVFTLDRFEMGGYEAALRQSRRDPVCAYFYCATLFPSVEAARLVFRPRWRVRLGLSVPRVDACFLRATQLLTHLACHFLGTRGRPMQQFLEYLHDQGGRHARIFFLPISSRSNCKNHRANSVSVMWWCQPVQLLTS
jgi:hypothetical protein